MSEITTKNITAVQAAGRVAAGERLYECDDGARKSTVRLRLQQKEIPGAVVLVCDCACCDDFGIEHELPGLRHEITFMLGENPDADPETVIEALLQERAMRAHAALRQLDAIAAMGLPTVPTGVHSEEAPRVRAVAVDGGGNDLLSDGGK